MKTNLKYFLGAALLTVGQITLAHSHLSVCDRSQEVKEMIELNLQKPCDQITETDLAAQDHFQIGFNDDLIEVKPKDTSGFKSARFLYLNCNPNLAAIPSDLAAGMDKIDTLAIHTNPNLRQLPEDFFHSVGESVEWIMMMDNGLTSLPDSFFERFAVRTRPVQFSLDGNPFDQQTLERIQKQFNVELDENGQLPHSFTR